MDKEGHRGKVMVVEDVALIRITTVDMVEQIGFAATGAADAAEALALLREDSEIEILPISGNPSISSSCAACWKAARRRFEMRIERKEKPARHKPRGFCT